MTIVQILFAFTLLLVYFSLHSILAADRIKAWFSSFMGSYFRYYRLIYNILSTLLLFLLLGWMTGFPKHLLFETNAWTKGAAMLFLVPGAWLFLSALWQYQMGEFLGTQQLKGKDTVSAADGLKTTGINALVRHPLYLGTILFLFGLFLFYPQISSLVFLISVLLYLPFGIHFEEKKLRRQFGQAYLDYEKQVKRLIPGVW